METSWKQSQERLFQIFWTVGVDSLHLQNVGMEAPLSDGGETETQGFHSQPNSFEFCQWFSARVSFQLSGGHSGDMDRGLAAWVGAIRAMDAFRVADGPRRAHEPMRSAVRGWACCTTHLGRDEPNTQERL